MSRAVVAERPTRVAPPRDTWLISGQPTHQTYRCWCWLGKPCRTNGTGAWCPCYGRPDPDQTPAHCCSRRWPSPTLVIGAS